MNKDLSKDFYRYVLPSMVSMLLSGFYSMVDGIFVGNAAGSQALAAINLVYPIQACMNATAFGLGVGGAVLMSKHMGNEEYEQADRAMGTTLSLLTIAGLGLMGFFWLTKDSIIHLLGATGEIAQYANEYISIIILCGIFPVLGNGVTPLIRNRGKTIEATLFMSSGLVTNILLDYVFVFRLRMGLAGAAIATLASRVFCAVVVLWQLRMDRQPIVVRNYRQIRPDGKMIRRVLALGIPSGIENSMFQLGKLAIQSSVSTLGTVAIAAQAMTNILENLNGIAAIGVGIGLMTVVGQCLGAGRKDEAVYYIKKLSVLAEIIVVASCLLVFALTIPVTKLGGMEPESARMCFHMISWITVVKPIVWTLAFIPAYGLRAAGDVKFSMITSCITMWTFRFCLCVYLIRFRGFGPMAVWIGMFTDWTVRGIVFSLRFHSRKWLKHKVV